MTTALSTLWYRAAWSAGEGLIGLPDEGASNAPPVLRAALRLADAEGLVAALEAWTGEEVEWRPLDEDSAPTQRAAQGLSFEVIGLTDAAPRGTRCLLPLRAVARRVAVPPLMRSEVCEWQRVDLDVELDVFDLAEAQLASLQPGRLLLLPGSFDAGWRVHLCHAALGLRLPARWTAQRALALEHGVPSPRVGALRARLRRRATMNPGALLGFGGPAVAEIEATPEADWQAVLEGTELQLGGALMPAFGGQALKIDGRIG